MESKEIIKNDDLPERNRESVSRRQFLKTTSVAILANLLDGNLSEVRGLLEKGAWGGEEKEKAGPKITIDVFYAPHDTAEDLKGLSEKFKKSDVFVSERIGWNEEYKKDFSEVAAGKMTPQQFFKRHELDNEPGRGRFESHERALVKMIYNSGKHIEFFDASRNNPLAMAIVMNLQRIYSPEIGKDFPELIVSFKKNMEEFSKLQVERESHILNEFSEFRRKLDQGGISELADKKKLNILFSMGGLHTGLYHSLKKSGEAVSIDFIRKPYIHSHFSEVVRRYMFEKEVGDELAARALAEIFVPFAMKLGRLSPDTNKKLVFARKIVSLFTFDELKKLFGKLQKAGYEEVAVLRILLGIFQEKGIKIPRSEAEFNVMVENFRLAPGVSQRK